MSYFYSQAVVVDNTMYISGCLGMDPVSGNLVSGGIEPEANQVEFLCAVDFYQCMNF
jgi:enamine deaminase RidA (YjgF/YER057c/UK114 family)